MTPLTKPTNDNALDFMEELGKLFPDLHPHEVIEAYEYHTDTIIILPRTERKVLAAYEKGRRWILTT